jgi:hypothetical protein
MVNPAFNITGVNRFQWDSVADRGDASDVVLRFADSKQRLLPKALDLAGFRMRDWHFQEKVYDGCDEVRVLDQNLDGAQLEFGRFVVQFVRRGEVVGEHIADSVAVRRAG